ncbi:MAG: hypothetical protein M3081_04300, partial [Gemmatimonadota bacterium]|nr:hypothetical protein [Gemmatimonadota bacterium]
LQVYALSGTPLAVPTALNTIGHSVVRAESSNSYDVVFDINGAGQGLIYPSVVIGLFGRNGVIKSTTAFDALTVAPGTNYNDSTATTFATGDVLLIRASSPACQTALSPYVFSKLAIDSINTVTRTISFRMRVDPNCGFRSFADGIPKE